MSGLPFVWLTCADDLQSHAVSLVILLSPAEPMADGVPALGGHLILLWPSVLAGPAGPRCEGCGTSVPPDAEDRTSEIDPLTLAWELAPHALAHPAHSPDDHAAQTAYALRRAAHAMASAHASPRRQWWPLGIGRRHGGESR